MHIQVYCGNTREDSTTTISHHGVIGMHWGIRRYQNKDGSLTPAGEKHRNALEGKQPDKSANVRMKELNNAMDDYIQKHNDQYNKPFQPVDIYDDMPEGWKSNARGDIETRISDASGSGLKMELDPFMADGPGQMFEAGATRGQVHDNLRGAKDYFNKTFKDRNVEAESRRALEDCLNHVGMLSYLTDKSPHDIANDSSMHVSLSNPIKYNDPKTGEPKYTATLNFGGGELDNLGFFSVELSPEGTISSNRISWDS